MPLASVMEAYRVGFREVWEAIVAESASRAHLNGEALRILTEKTLAAQDIYTAAMTLSYREEQSRLLSSDKSERSVLIDSLLHGRLFERWSVWEAADYLRLPTGGPFVVIAAEVEGVGSEALPQIESKLRSMDVYSAWRLLPDLHVGIVHVKTDKHLAKVLALVSRMAKNRLGVSPWFDHLRETAQALRYARVVLRGRFDPGHPITLFDGSILGCAAVSAPEVMVKLVTPIIECFTELADNEREILLETFRVWLRTTDRCESSVRCCSVTPTPCAIGYTESSSGPGVPCRDHAISQSCAWHSKCIAALCSRSMRVALRRKSTGGYCREQRNRWWRSVRKPIRPAAVRGGLRQLPQRPVGAHHKQLQAFTRAGSNRRGSRQPRDRWRSMRKPLRPAVIGGGLPQVPQRCVLAHGEQFEPSIRGGAKPRAKPREFLPWWSIVRCPVRPAAIGARLPHVPQRFVVTDDEELHASIGAGGRRRRRVGAEQHP